MMKKKIHLVVYRFVYTSKTDLISHAWTASGCLIQSFLRSGTFKIFLRDNLTNTALTEDHDARSTCIKLDINRVNKTQ